MKLIPIVLLALGMFAAADAATAQVGSPPRPSRVELWGAVTGMLSGPVSTLTSSYSPPLLFDGDFTSRGGQTLLVDTSRAIGLTGGVNIFPTRRLGLQLLFTRASSHVSGANGAYDVALQYVSRQPPSYEPQIVNVSQSTAWPNTSGSLTQAAVAFNALVRIGRPDRLSVTISGGPTYYRLSGDVQPLGFTTFVLGGHSVLFQEDYRLALALGPTHALGWDAGGEFNAAVGRHAAIIMGFRYFGGPLADVTVSPKTILNADQLTFLLPIADVASRLALAPARMSVSGSRLLLGLRFTL